MLSDKFEIQTTTEAATAVSHSELMHAEISRYKSEPLLKLSEKPLQWWRIHRHSFPHLAELAQKYLAIVATSTSERLFSTAGNIINSKRAVLSTEHVNELVFLHENSPAIHNLPYKKLHCECEQCIEK